MTTPATHHQRITLSLSPDARDILTRTKAPSAYVSAIVRARWLAWQAALGQLMQAGWQADDLQTAVRALVTCSDEDMPGSANVARLLLRPCSWRAAPKMGPDEVVWLMRVAREYWAGNQDLRAALG